MTKQAPDFTANPDADDAWRAALRREMIARRQALPAEVHRQASTVILARLADRLQARQAGRVAFCWPIRGEVDCRSLIGQLLASGWQAAMPTVIAAQAPMEFRAWTPTCRMTSDPHGIPVPAERSLVIPDVVLLPLVAFDAAGYRLGYGGGYFDRTLAALRPRPLSIGVGFACVGVADLRPGPHDILLDEIITENPAPHPATP